MRNDVIILELRVGGGRGGVAFGGRVLGWVVVGAPFGRQAAMWLFHRVLWTKNLA